MFHVSKTPSLLERKRAASKETSTQRKRAASTTSTMATYGTDIPPLPPLADADGLSLIPIGAPRIVAGTPLNVADIAQAEDEYRARKRLKCINLAAPCITVDEVESAAIRYHAIVSVHAAHVYPETEVPAWFAPALAMALQPLQDAVQGLQITVQGLQHAESRNIARVANGQLQRDDDRIEPLVDNNGTIPNGFPVTTHDVKKLPSADVDAILAAYGQVPRGNLDARRCQLGVWLGLYQRFH